MAAAYPMVALDASEKSVARTTCCSRSRSVRLMEVMLRFCRLDPSAEPVCGLACSFPAFLLLSFSSRHFRRRTSGSLAHAHTRELQYLKLARATDLANVRMERRLQGHHDC